MPLTKGHEHDRRYLSQGRRTAAATVLASRVVCMHPDRTSLTAHEMLSARGIAAAASWPASWLANGMFRLVVLDSPRSFLTATIFFVEDCDSSNHSITLELHTANGVHSQCGIRIPCVRCVFSAGPPWYYSLAPATQTPHRIRHTSRYRQKDFREPNFVCVAKHDACWHARIPRSAGAMPQPHGNNSRGLCLRSGACRSPSSSYLQTANHRHRASTKIQGPMIVSKIDQSKESYRVH